MIIEKTNAKGFISSISQSHPSIIIFRNKGEDYNKKVKSIEKIIQNLEKSMPKVFFYDYVVDESEENAYLAETLEIPNSLTAILYKNGCFKRYQSGPIDASNLRKLWSAAKDKPTQSYSQNENNQYLNHNEY